MQWRSRATPSFGQQSHSRYEYRYPMNWANSTNPLRLRPSLNQNPSTKKRFRTKISLANVSTTSHSQDTAANDSSSSSSRLLPSSLNTNTILLKLFEFHHHTSLQRVTGTRRVDSYTFSPKTTIGEITRYIVEDIIPSEWLPKLIKRCHALDSNATSFENTVVRIKYGDDYQTNVTLAQNSFTSDDLEAQSTAHTTIRVHLCLDGQGEDSTFPCRPQDYALDHFETHEYLNNSDSQGGTIPLVIRTTLEEGDVQGNVEACHILQYNQEDKMRDLKVWMDPFDSTLVVGMAYGGSSRDLPSSRKRRINCLDLALSPVTAKACQTNDSESQQIAKRAKSHNSRLSLTGKSQMDAQHKTMDKKDETELYDKLSNDDAMASEKAPDEKETTTSASQPTKEIKEQTIASIQEKNVELNPSPNHHEKSRDNSGTKPGIETTVSMIPCGLGWRGAVKRSIISSPFKETSFISSNSAEMKRLKVSLMDKKTVSKGEHNKHSMEPKLMMKHPDKPSKHVDKTKVRKPSSIEIKEAIKPKEVVRQSVNPVTSLQHKTSAKSISSVSLKKTNMLPRTEKKMVGRRQSSKPERNIVLDGPAEKGISKSNTKMCALKSETRTSEFETKVKDIVNKEESAIVLSDTSDEKSDILRAEKVQAKLDLKGESILSKEAKLKNSQNEEHKTEVSSKKDKKHDTQDQNLPGIKASDLKLIATPKEPDEIFRKDIADLPQNIEKVQSRSSEETISTSKKRTKELPDDDTVLENRDEPSLSGHSRTVAPIRPPPGLSPPPGFFSESSTSLQESENSRKPSSTLFDTSSQTASTIDQVGDVKSSCSGNETIEISGMEYYARPSSTPSERGADNDLDFALPNNDLLMSLLGDDQEPNIITGDCLFYKEEPKLSNESEQQVSSPLLGLGQDINVMDFLSFLDDGEKSDNTLSGDDNISSLRYDYGGAPSSLQSNPWRESSQTPRALAYGIEVEQEKLGYATSEIPLLTPAFVLGNAETPTHQHEDEEEADEKYLNGDPFLASLLQGDSQDEI